MQDQLEKVNQLRSEYFKMINMSDKLKKKMEQEVEKLQKECSHEEFYKEDDGDYHRPGYYYTCKLCGYFTKCKPNAKISNL